MQCLLQIPEFINILENISNNQAKEYVLFDELKNLQKNYFQNFNDINIEQLIQILLTLVNQGGTQHQRIDFKGDSSGKFFSNFFL
jgi:hypothetical protein